MTTRPTRVVRRLLLSAVAAGALAAVTGGPGGTLALLAGMAALATAAGVAMRAQWVAAAPEPAPAAAAGPRTDVAAELARLRAEHLARVDAALDEGRPELARALVEEHQARTRRLLGEDVAQRS